MKKFPKSVVVCVCVVSIVVFIVGFFGITSTYGDIRTAKIYGNEEIQLGLDLEQTVELILKADSDTAVDENTLNTCKAIIEKRIQTVNISEYEIYTDLENSSIILRLPMGATSFYDTSYVASYIGKTGLFEIRESDSADVDGNPTGVTAQNVIATNKDITISAISGSPIMDMFSYRLDFALKGDAKAALKAVSEKFVQKNEGTKDVDVVSYWLDGEKIGTTKVESVMEKGVLTLQSMTISSNDIQTITMALETNTLPMSFKCSEVLSEKAYGAENAAKALSAALLISLAALFVYFSIKYRLAGILLGVGILGAVGCVFGAFSGLFSVYSGTYFTVASMMGLCTGLFIVVKQGIDYCEEVKQSLETSSVQKASLFAFSETWKTSLKINVAVFIVSLAVKVFFAPNSGMFVKHIVPMLASPLSTLNFANVALFATALMYTVLFGTLFILFGSAIATRSAAEYKCFKKPVLFGGNKNV
ncbi:MAG: hypothetical protein RR058_04610 [Oscillospiraceae bacterium]